MDGSFVNGFREPKMIQNPHLILFFFRTLLRFIIWLLQSKWLSYLSLSTLNLQISHFILSPVLSKMTISPQMVCEITTMKI